MESRRPSLVSTASMRHRKYSTDRVLRQAELSARLEELGHPLALASAQIDEQPDEDGAEQTDRIAIKSLMRADTSISPFDFHPGQRLNSIPLKATAGLNTNFSFEAKTPWPEPTVAQQEDIERRAAAPRRVDTTSLDVSPAQAHIYRNLARNTTRHPLQRWLSWRTKMPKAVEPSVVDGLQIASTMHAMLGLRFLAQKSPDWLRRQQLHVFEYKTGMSQVFSCDSNSAFNDTESMKTHLRKIDAPSRHDEGGTRVRLIHIRNNVETFKFMDEAFAISSTEIHYGERGFREWMQEDRDSKRSSNMTIRWRPGYDIHRQVICMAMGIDLGSSSTILEEPAPTTGKDKPREHSLFRRRRIAIYLQRGLSAAAPHPRVTQFNTRGHDFGEFARQDTIMICEYSSDVWSEFLNTPALLTLQPVAGLHRNDSAAVMASAISHVFWGIVTKWQSQIAAIHQPFADLEERVHGNPSDITNSDQVWESSRNLQNMLKLVGRHLKAIQTFQDDFELFAELGKVEWLDDVLIEMKHVGDSIRMDYIEPLEHMIDLMYKSVTIRDSRLSLELGTSLWRLSWITFIFLPLTFLVGFFGMNVDTFRDNPSIKWYFVGLVPLAVLIATFWLAFSQYRLEPKVYATRNAASGDTKDRKFLQLPSLSRI